ncbi:MAG: hypothetical protein NZ602_05645 [Thermoguttaceae bacterium]|nr:hypothetical protein [Thermoguttaceae bacterium]MDW8037932.1 hypothetical protein [Thermoguttaceae bacterium]
MAREHQGLQIALMIFVLLTLILGVTTFIFFRRYDETVVKMEAESQKATQAQTNLGIVQGEKVKLLKFLGFPESEKIDNVEEKCREEFATYGSNFPEEQRNYRQLLKLFHKQIAELNESLEAEKTQVQTLQNINERRNEEYSVKIDAANQARDKAGRDLQEERDKFAQAHKEFTNREETLRTDLENARKEKEAALAQLQKQLEAATQQIQKLTQLNAEKSKKLEDLVKETFEVPDGEISWVNQRQRTVWINLGWADGLQRQTTFAVYDANTYDVSKSGKKGSIEVTEIWDAHLAEARIIDDQPANPIMPGDKVHTPLWTPGERRRIALTGDIDLDDDGQSDLQKLLSFITLQGAVVDCYLDDKSPNILTGQGKPGGRMSINTRYLVVGKPPEGAGAKERLDAYSRMLSEARSLRIQEVPLKQFLSQMGWRETSPVITYGPGANPAHFRPKPQEGLRPVSGGKVSELFQERRPPAPKP